MLAMAILYGYWVLRTNHYVFTMVFLWHHVKEEVQIELELQIIYIIGGVLSMIEGEELKKEGSDSVEGEKDYH